LAQQNIQAELLNGHTMGFPVTPSAASLTDAAHNDYTRYFFKAGVQVWAYPHGPRDVLRRSGPGITLALGVYTNNARGSESGVPGAEQTRAAPIVTVDGHRVPTSAAHTQFAAVTVPCAGDYDVRASLPGTSATWHATAHVTSVDAVTNTTFYPARTGDHPLALQNLHDGATPGCAAGAAATARAQMAAISGQAGAGPALSPGSRRLAATGSGSSPAWLAIALLGSALAAWRVSRRRVRGTTQ
jgi:hypothetical protein